MLCGGRSSRMGADKATLEIDGVPMARRVADALVAAGAGAVTAIGGDEAVLRAAGLEVVADRHPGEGPLAATADALAWSMTDVVAVLACDLLQPDAAAVRALVEHREGADADVAVPVAGGRPQWTHGVWHRRVTTVLDEIFAAGERSLVGATAGLRVALVDLADPEVTLDADRPEDLDRRRRPDRP